MIEEKSKLHTPELRRGDLIMRTRTSKRRTQSDVANWINTHYSNDGINITQPRISDIENGSDMKSSELFLIAECLGIPLEQLRCFELKEISDRVSK